MDIFWKKAQTFMEVIHAETGFPVLIYDETGHIVKATDTARIGDLHTGARKILKGEVDEYAVTAREAALNPLVREGYSCPIIIRGKRVSGIGITGKLDLVKPIARIAARLIHTWHLDLAHQEMLRRSEQKYKAIFDHSPSGMFQSSPEGRLLTANAALAEICGYASPEAMVRKITDISRQLYLNPDDRDRLKTDLLRKKKIRQFTTRFRHHSGKRIDVTINAHCTADPETGQIYFEGLVQDISEQIALEKWMVQTEKIMSLGGLAAGMAHEINNPLGAIVQTADMLKMRLFSSQPATLNALEQTGIDKTSLETFFALRNVLELLDNIHASGLRALKIVTNMLDFARANRPGHIQSAPAQLVDNTLELVEKIYDPKKGIDFRKIRIVRDYAPDLPDICCDPGEIQQVLLNLLNNAAQVLNTMDPVRRHKAAPAITIRLLSENDTLVIWFQDNGPGIAPEALGHLFEPFFTTKSPEMGTGLGLSVSRHIIENNHKGSLTVDSSPETGTVFTIRLPCAKGPD